MYLEFHAVQLNFLGTIQIYLFRWWGWGDSVTETSRKTVRQNLPAYQVLLSLSASVSSFLGWM